jgi:hypothetical protein
MSPKTLLHNVMRKGGLEPPRIAPLDPKSKNNAPQSQRSEERKLTKAVENGRIRPISATFSATAPLFDPPFRALLIWKWCAVALLVLTACSKPPISTAQTDNKEVSVDLLFTNDGCSVYRFEDDGRSHYYTDCRGNTRTAHVENCGKGCQRTVYEDIPSSGRKP